MSSLLIVDDDPEIRVILSQALADAGYTVETAPDGRTALEMVTTSPPDLLITDLLMPGLTGWSLFARARRLSPTLPVIVMSSVDTGFRHQETSLPDHAVLLRKPFALDHLQATVARLLAGVRSDREPMPVYSGSGIVTAPAGAKASTARCDSAASRCARSAA